MFLMRRIKSIEKALTATAIGPPTMNNSNTSEMLETKTNTIHAHSASGRSSTNGYAGDTIHNNITNTQTPTQAYIHAAQQSLSLSVEIYVLFES